MLQKISRKISELNRRRQMARIRLKFARCGHLLDDLDDSKIEVALTQGERPIGDVSLTAKSIYFALRRLAADGESIRKRGDQPAGK